MERAASIKVTRSAEPSFLFLRFGEQCVGIKIRDAAESYKIFRRERLLNLLNSFVGDFEVAHPAEKRRQPGDQRWPTNSGSSFFGFTLAMSVILPRPPHGTGQTPCTICHANDAAITSVTAA